VRSCSPAKERGPVEREVPCHYLSGQRPSPVSVFRFIVRRSGAFGTSTRAKQFDPLPPEDITNNGIPYHQRSKLFTDQCPNAGYPSSILGYHIHSAAASKPVPENARKPSNHASVSPSSIRKERTRGYRTWQTGMNNLHVTE
jgi:hypothetical protein